LRNGAFSAFSSGYGEFSDAIPGAAAERIIRLKIREKNKRKKTD
jgi:hypothetical protein